MNMQHPTPRLRHRQRGATLLMTLGILSVLGVMVASFLIVSRLQRQTTTSRQNRTIARNYIDVGLYQAMRQIENSFLVVTNYSDRTPQQGEVLTYARVAPVTHWFARGYEEVGQLSDKYAYQSGDVLASPAFSNAPTVNLLTPQVLRMIPSLLTNGLALSASSSHPFRSGWIPENMLPETVDIKERLLDKPARIAYAIFNCSSMIDANAFLGGPTAKKNQRVCFNQSDVTNWVETAEPQKRLSELKHDPFHSPFFHLSYDPDPDVYPLHYDCFETCGALGYQRFGAYPVVNLNVPQMYEAMKTLKEHATYWKFNINSITNFMKDVTKQGEDETPWYNDSNFKVGWLDPVVSLLEMMRHEDASRLRWADSQALAWSIVNYMDHDRFPQISDFVEADLPTRLGYSVEDVPLINKITVFNVFDPRHPGNPNPDLPSAVDLDYYFPHRDTSNLSNHYAVAVELWYPFAPKPPPYDTACYVGIYTNSEDITTTTNRPWTQNEMRDWFLWNSANNSNSVMQILFNAWATLYKDEVGPALDGHPLWTVVTNESSLWFTPSMTNHPSWPIADTNGAFSIHDTPIWQAFYPETYAILSTNESGTVTTNVYTYLTTTNSYVEWVSSADMTTNRLIGQIGTTEPDPYPVLLWTNLTSGAYTTNVFGAFLDPDGNLVTFYTPADPSQTNSLQAIMPSPDTGLISVTVSNNFTGEVFASNATSFVLSPWTGDGPLTFAIQTNLYVYTEILPVQPLPMPDDLGVILSVLFAILPTDSLSSLYTFLMLRPAEFTDLDWNHLFVSIGQTPAIQNRILPSHQAPTLGNMSKEDRYAIWPDITDSKAVIEDPDRADKLKPNHFQGYFWTVYPKTTVCFRQVEEVAPPEGVPPSGSAEYYSVTNYYELGALMPGQTKRNTIWLRPVVTVNRVGEDMTGSPPPVEDPTVTDMIVDEALLTGKGDADSAIPVWGWTSTTNICIPEPRDNAYARKWRGFTELWDNVINTTNLSTGVSEMPFIHTDAPFTTIGDIGHVYTEYEHGTTEDEPPPHEPGQRDYDTVTFSTRSGAALLDLFTISPTNGPKRGLVQANTSLTPVLETLLADVRIGWTNVLDGATDLTGWTRLSETPAREARWCDVYADALTNAPLNMGWRSFADMMPSIATNRVLAQQNVWGSTDDLHSLHDYTEDIVRGLIDKVSFRQNVFVIVVAAQALSPASSDIHPIVLSDQRAAITVIRDAYTGRWTVQSWTWLSD